MRGKTRVQHRSVEAVILSSIYFVFAFFNPMNSLIHVYLQSDTYCLSPSIFRCANGMPSLAKDIPIPTHTHALTHWLLPYVNTSFIRINEINSLKYTLVVASPLATQGNYFVAILANNADARPCTVCEKVKIVAIECTSERLNVRRIP